MPQRTIERHPIRFAFYGLIGLFCLYSLFCMPVLLVFVPFLLLTLIWMEVLRPRHTNQLNRRRSKSRPKVKSEAHEISSGRPPRLRWKQRPCIYRRNVIGFRGRRS